VRPAIFCAQNATVAFFFAALPAHTVRRFLAATPVVQPSPPPPCRFLRLLLDPAKLLARHHYFDPLLRPKLISLIPDSAPADTLPGLNALLFSSARAHQPGSSTEYLILDANMQISPWRRRPLVPQDRPSLLLRTQPILSREHEQTSLFNPLASVAAMPLLSCSVLLDA